MSSIAIDLPLAKRFCDIRFSVLMGLYAIIPIAILLVAVDQLFLDKLLLNTYLPVSPREWAFWAIVFNFPHIVSSFITLAEKEYLTHYRKKLLNGLSVIVTSVLFVVVLLPMLVSKPVADLSYSALYVVFATYTMYHLMAQQFGIGMMLMKAKPTRSYELWRLLATVPTATMYLMIFAKSSMVASTIGSYTLWEIGTVVAGVFLIPVTALGIHLTKGANSNKGKFYFLSNISMLVIVYMFFLMDYSVLVIAVPRFLHDVTAFIVYSTHDHNRNLESKPNFIYRYLAFLPIPTLILCPILAIGVANTILLVPENIIAPFLFMCGFFHYYLESFVWKREAIHRHSVKFA